MAASDDVKILEGLTDDPAIRAGAKGRYKGKSYTLAQLNELLSSAKDKADKEAKAAAEAQRTADRGAAQERRAAELTKDELAREIRMARGELKAADGNLTLAINRGEDITGAQSVLAAAYRKLQQLNPTDKMLEGITVPQVSRGGAEREGATQMVGIPTDTAARASAQNIRLREADPNTIGVKSKKIVVINGVEMEETTYNDGRTSRVATGNKVISSATTTPTGGTPASVTPAKSGAPVTAQTATDWENTFKQYFPAKAWLLTDLDRAKYPQLFDLLKRAHDQKYYDTAEGRARFAAELDGTDYYKELASSGKVRQIKSIVGDLGFESTDFSRFVTQAINFGWDDNRLKQETYREVFRRNPDGTYANPTAVTRTRQSNEFLSVSLIAKNFFNQASEDTITKVLTGDITTEDFQRQQRTIAKTRYSHLSDLIDQGVTLEDLASNYKTSAAKLLEIDPNSIDMSDAQYEIALAYDGDGGKRTMTTGEWERLLRTDSRYGWERTENAKSEARSLASNIAQAFGRII